MVFVLISLFTLVSSVRLRTSSSQIELEPALPEGFSYVGYDCSTTETNYIKEVCTLCQADFVYTAPYPDVAYLEGYYEETKEQIQPILTDVSDHIPQAKMYAVAVNNSMICISGFQFKEEADYEAIFDYFLGISPINVAVPEIFDIENSTTLTYIGTRYNGSSYDYLSLNYDAQDTAEVSESTTYYLDTMYTYFEYGVGYNVYSGTCDIKSGSNKVSVGFEIETDYYRNYSDTFVSTLDIGTDYTVNEWAKVLDADSPCTSVQPPRGISSLQSLHCTSSTQTFTYSSNSDEMIMNEETIGYTTPPFAISPEIAVDSAPGFLVNDKAEQTCIYKIYTNWVYYNYTISLMVYSDADDGHMKANGVFTDPTEITVEQIDKDFYQQMFPEDNDMFPVFLPEDPYVVTDFKNGTIMSPQIQLYFEPDTSYAIYGEEAQGGSLEVISGRVHEAVQTVINSYTIGPDWLYDYGISVYETTVYMSSADINVTSSPIMASMLDADREEWKQGVIIEIRCTFNDNCEKNDFCGILQRYGVEEGETELKLDGYIVENTIVLESDMSDIPLSDSVDFEEAGLSAEYEEQGLVLIVEGAFYLQVDSETTLRFIGTISQGENYTAELKTQSEDLWENAMEVLRLHIIGISLTGFVDGNGTLIESTSLGNALIGEDCWENNQASESCLSGDTELYLNFHSYTYNNFSLYIQNITTEEFYNYLGGYSYQSFDSIPLASACLSFPAGIFIDHQYESSIFYLSGNAEYCGVYGELEGTTDSFVSGDFDINVTLDDFYFLRENAKMSSPAAFLKTDREEEKSEGTISGDFYAWEIEKSESISINNNKYQFSTSGYIFAGIYNVTLDFTGETNPDISTAIFSVDFKINEDHVDSIEESTRDLIYQWVNYGYDALVENGLFIDNLTQSLSYWDAMRCNSTLTCPSKLQCTTNINEECTQYSNKQSCSSNNTGCENIQVECTLSEVICIKQKRNCDGECQCLSEVTVCKKWENSCMDRSDECQDKIIEKDYSKCSQTERLCEKIEKLDLECELRCEWIENTYNKAKEIYEAYEEGYEESLEELKGFEEILDKMKTNYEFGRLVEIDRIDSIKNINETGLGPSDFTMTVTGKTVSLEADALEETQYDVIWDFYTARENQAEVYKNTKENIIENSKDELTEDLVQKSPQEVIRENVDYNENQVVSEEITSLLQLFGRNN
ncbi:unnamed protein product [Blepharisma stoltei]|uniref:TNFR-Cys domain-containing protein n=1 Tax=Blepharisma stoltei TaxID=1481888 RepID=A0AAU9JHR1_9CILI|nr:unnamed protein product [Blepharisma stoltei]